MKTNDPNDSQGSASGVSSTPPSTPPPPYVTPVEEQPVRPSSPQETAAPTLSALESAKGHVERALEHIRAGSRTSLHLNPEEQAAMEKYLKELPRDSEDLEGEMVRRLVAGEEVAGAPQTA